MHAGVCFDIEETEGEQELIDAFEQTFAMLQKEGLQVLGPRPRSPIRDLACSQSGATPGDDHDLTLGAVRGHFGRVAHRAGGLMGGVG